jgi:hypothetical protein
MDEKSTNPSEPAAPDRRREPRQTCVAKAVLFPDGPGPTRRAFISNISMFGVGFRAPVPCSIGQRYRMKVEAGPMKFNAKLEIRSCRGHGDTGFVIGGQFIANELDFEARSSSKVESIPRNPSHDLMPKM